MSAKIGVLVSAYYHNEFISQCLNSVIHQWHRDFKLYFRDDSMSKLGIAKSYNYLAMQAYEDGCEYIQLLGGDDWLEVNALEELLKEAEKGYEFVFPQWNKTTGEVWKMSEGVNVEVELKYNFFSSTPLIRSEAFWHLKGYREDIESMTLDGVPIRIPEDWDLWIRMLTSEFPFKYSFVNKYIYNYRVHPKQTSQNVSLEWDRCVQWFRKEYNIWN